MKQRAEWKMKDPRAEFPAAVAEIAERLQIPSLVAALLYLRGNRTTEAAQHFLRKDDMLFHDPYLLPDMDAAVTRILAAVDAGERIAIFGDYDVDGITSTSALYLYLRSLGAEVSYYIPNRSGEGYGMNREAIASLAGQGVRLIVTVDTGVTAVEEAAYARSLGMDMVITDHHDCCGALPDAAAVVNPRRRDCQYPFCELAGVGVVFKLLCALELRRSGEDADPVQVLHQICCGYADLAAIGTIADVMPLTDENRLLVSIGLGLIAEHPRCGMEVMLQQTSPEHPSKNDGRKKKITSSLIGYTIAPRLNAAGRISSAMRAVDLFLAERSEEAAAIAAELSETNRQRQQLENKILEEAYAKIEEEHDFAHDSAIILDSETWHSGVIGIVASRLTDRYHLPAILITFRDDAETGKGSGRSIRGLHLTDALNACAPLLVRYGGHELAAGMSVTREQLPAFRRAFNDYVRTHLETECVETGPALDMELLPRELTLEHAEALYALEPYGVGNPVPLFLLRDVVLRDIQAIGGGKHMRFTAFCADGHAAGAIWFGVSPDTLAYREGDTVDLACNLDVNEYMGRRTVQLIVRDMRLSEYGERRFEREEAFYEMILRQGAVGVNADVLPTRDDFVRIYRYLRAQIAAGTDTLRLETVCAATGWRDAHSYARMRAVVDILTETKVITADPVEDRNDMRHFTLCAAGNGKADLEQAPLYLRLAGKSRQDDV